MKRIKLFESFNPNPFLLDSFTEAESKLKRKDGIVLTGVKGDTTQVEERISKIPHRECYILITKKEGPAQNWESDVFLIGAEDEDVERFTTIEDYFNDGENGTWTDPAGGVHSDDEVDGAAMYETAGVRVILKAEDFLTLVGGGEVSGPGYNIILEDLGYERMEFLIKKAIQNEKMKNR